MVLDFTLISKLWFSVGVGFYLVWIMDNILNFEFEEIIPLTAAAKVWNIRCE
jgi:hypothetical protein